MALYTPHRLSLLMLRGLAQLPLLALALLGSLFGQLAYWLDWRRGRIVRRNLEICFPGLSRRERRRLAAAHFRCLGRATFCSVGVGWHHCEQRLRDCVDIKGLHHYRDALSHGRPVILLAPHFVNLEIGWLRLALERVMVCMYREPRAHLFHWAAHRQRLRFGGVAIERGAHLTRLIRLLREGHTFYYLPDTDPGKKTPHVFASFFGEPAATVTALGRIAQMTQACVMLCVTRERGWGRWEIEIQPPFKRYPSTDAHKDARHMNASIEDAVTESPAQYLWVHRRFKTRPCGTRSFYG